MKKLVIISILALVAGLNALYLTYNAYLIKWDKNTPSYMVGIEENGNKMWFACDFNSTFSCSWVFSHDFARLFWIPFSLLALIVYPTILILSILAIKWKVKNIYKILTIIASLGVLFNSYIIFNEYLVSTYCVLCLICSAIIITILILSIMWMKESKSK